MLDELTKSVKASLYERATSPLFGTFIVSWCIWNYKTLFVLISSMDVDEKFDYIETFIYSGWWSCVTTALIYPLVTTLVFIFLYPYPALFVYKYWHEKQINLKKAKQEIEDETPLTIEESRNIRRELFNLESEYEKEVTRKNTEISRLKDIINNLEMQIDTAPLPEKKAIKTNIATSAPTPEPTKEQTNILYLISKSGGLLTDTVIIEKSDFDKVKTEYYLEDLANNGYLTRYYRQQSRADVSELTTKSKRVMVEKGLAN